MVAGVLGYGIGSALTLFFVSDLVVKLESVTEKFPHTGA